MAENDLKNLSKDYASGKITTDEYRKERKRLLDNITKVESPTPENPPSGNKTVFSKGPIYIMLWVVGLVGAICILAVALKMGEPEQSPQAIIAPTQATVNPVTLSPPIKLEDHANFVRTFLEKDDWSPMALISFQSKWVSLSTEQRKYVMEDPAYYVLRNTVVKRISAKETLAQNKGSYYRNDDLLAFAKLIAVEIKLSEPQFIHSSTLDESDDQERQPAAIEGKNIDTHNGNVIQILPISEKISKGPSQVPKKLTDDNIAESSSNKVICDNNWLTDQDPERYTLQLCILSNEDNVQLLLEEYADLNLKAVKFEDKGPLWIIYGIFDTYDQAEVHSGKLEDNLKSSINGNRVIIKISSLQDKVE